MRNTPELLLFRSSRPDFIETLFWGLMPAPPRDCSGLPGRTSLRLVGLWQLLPYIGIYCSGLPGRTSLRRQVRNPPLFGVRTLFRSSRPDFIETMFQDIIYLFVQDCSGLPGRTSLRQVFWRYWVGSKHPHCSGLPGRTSLRPGPTG